LHKGDYQKSVLPSLIGMVNIETCIPLIHQELITLLIYYRSLLVKSVAHNLLYVMIQQNLCTLSAFFKVWMVRITGGVIQIVEGVPIHLT